jgi:hypothetical protein
MSELIDLDNLTLNDIRRLRKALFERLLFEPVTDPDFERSAVQTCFVLTLHIVHGMSDLSCSALQLPITSCTRPSTWGVFQNGSFATRTKIVFSLNGWARDEYAHH